MGLSYDKNKKCTNCGSRLTGDLGDGEWYKYENENELLCEQCNKFYEKGLINLQHDVNIDNEGIILMNIYNDKEQKKYGRGQKNKKKSKIMMDDDDDDYLPIQPHKKQRSSRSSTRSTSNSKKTQNTTKTKQGKNKKNRKKKNKKNKDEDEYEVQSVEGRININKNKDEYYLVRWKGYGLNECTWIPFKNLTNASKKVRQFEKKIDKNKLKPCMNHDGYNIIPCWICKDMNYNGLRDLSKHGISYKCKKSWMK